MRILVPSFFLRESWCFTTHFAADSLFRTGIASREVAAMSSKRTTASRACVMTLVVYAAFSFTVVVCTLWPSPPMFPAFAGSRAIPDMDISLVMLESQSSKPPAPKMLPSIEVPKAPDERIIESAKFEPTSNSSTTTTQVSESHATGQSVTVEQLPDGAGTAFYDVPALGSSVVFVIDRSASMGLEQRLDRARQQLVASLNRLRPNTRFQVIAYARNAETLGPPGGLASATPEHVAQTVSALARLEAEGGTDHLKALRSALAMQPDVVFFLTDDDDLTAYQVREVTRLNRARASIHALCFVEPNGETALSALARQNRGMFRVVSDQR
jgi:hypothetical protein